MSLVEIPKLDALVLEPNKAADLPVDAVEALLARCTVLQSALVTRLLALRCASNGNGETREGDRPLDVREAAVRLGLSPDTLYRKHKLDQNYRDLTVHNGTRKVLFSERKIEAFLRRRTGR